MYLHTISALSGWKSHNFIITTSLSRIQVLFFIFPGILQFLSFPSSQRTFIWVPPILWVTIPNISPSFLRGVLIFLSCSSRFSSFCSISFFVTKFYTFNIIACFMPAILIMSASIKKPCFTAISTALFPKRFILLCSDRSSPNFFSSSSCPL